MTFGGKIKEAREFKGLTQNQLAELLNVKQNALSRWETGTCEPSIDIIRQLCVALECEPNFLFGWGF